MLRHLRSTATSNGTHRCAHARPFTRSTTAQENAPLRIQMDYTEPELPVLRAAGEVDTVTTPQFAELLWPRLQTTRRVLVLDLSEVTFLGVAGLELLGRAHVYAHHRGITLSVVTGTRAVERALEATGLDASLPRFPSVLAARAATLPGNGAVPQQVGREHRERRTSQRFA